MTGMVGFIPTTLITSYFLIKQTVNNLFKYCKNSGKIPVLVENVPCFFRHASKLF